MSLADLLITAQSGSHPACKNCPWNPSRKHINKPAYGVSCIQHGINWNSNVIAKSMLIAQDPAGTTPEKTGNLCGYCNARFSTDHSAQHGFSLWKAAVSLIDSGPECNKYMKPGFHVAKSVKLENLDKTPTLGEITGVLNQYYMNLQPK